MPDLPSGAGTFLFADTEGSTRPLRHLGVTTRGAATTTACANAAQRFPCV